MASVIDVSKLTLNAKEPDFENFVFERIFEQPVLNTIHRVYTGLTMQEKIVIAGIFGLTGIADTSCTRPSSGAGLPTSEKEWLPARIGDTFVHCQADVNALFKAYYDKIKSYAELYDIEGSDLYNFIAARIEQAASEAVLRLAWFGDKDVVEADVSVAGLADANHVKFFSPIDGIWKQAFEAETAGTLESVPLQASIIDTFDAMLGAADSRLRTATDAMFLVSKKVWDRYRKNLRDASLNFTVDYTINGLPTIKYDGKTVVNMETVWDRYIPLFLDEAGGDVISPDRIMLTVKDNIPVGTLNEGDFDQLESWYNRDERVNKMAYGFTLDAVLVEEYLAVIAHGVLPDEASAPSN